MSMGTLIEEYDEIMHAYPQYPEMRRDLHHLYGIIVRDLNYFKENNLRLPEFFDTTLPGIVGEDRAFLLNILHIRLEHSAVRGAWKNLSSFLHYLEFK
jgi:hypothetical protein